jgi:hypothetical protein
MATWKELKEFCNNLTDKQLEKKVILWREDESISDMDPMQLESDHYIDREEGEEYCYPESEAEKPIEKLEKVYEKGDPILHENF